MRSKSEVAVQSLVEKARSLQGRALSENLLPLAMEDEACIREISASPTNTDATYMVVLSLISHIEKFVDKRYEVVHDRSDNLRQYERTLSQLATASFTRSFRQTQITTLQFPLKFSRVSQADSRSSRSIQIADVLIGGMIEYSMSLTGQVRKNEYNQAVVELYGDENLIHLLPDLNFEEAKQFREGTRASEFIDFFAKNFS